MITTILWDIDNTLLDFQAAEKVAIQACFDMHDFGICTDEMLARYAEINHGYWKKLEFGEIEKERVLVGRFEDFFREVGLPVEKASEFNEEYQKRLGDTCVFMDRGGELIEKLKGLGFKQYAATNGTLTAQERKLRNSGLDQLLDGAFISDLIGYEKPSAGFFDHVFSELTDVKKEEMIMIGDSLTSDMRGGTGAGIYSIWYNPKHEENTTDVKPDLEIDDLWKVLEVLGIPVAE